MTATQMIYPSADKLEKLGSKYGLVVLAAKRAKQIKSGVQPLVDTDSRNPLTIALEEIAAGKITCDIPDTDYVAPTHAEPEVAQLLAIPERTDDEGELDGVEAEEEITLTLDADEQSEKDELDESEENDEKNEDVEEIETDDDSTEDANNSDEDDEKPSED